MPRRVTLKLAFTLSVSADEFTVLLNGTSLAGEECRRDVRDHLSPYDGLRMEIDLRGIRPHRGRNLLEISLDKRPEGLGGGLNVEEVEIAVEYGHHPSG